MANYKFSEKAIAEAAYYIWLNNGCPSNTSTQDWTAAINQLNSLYNAKKSSCCRTISSAKKSTAKKSLKKSK